jgi:hypothetical protein
MSKDLLEKLQIELSKTNSLYELIKDKNLKQLPNNVLGSKIKKELSQLKKSIEHMNKKLEYLKKNLK